MTSNRKRLNRNLIDSVIMRDASVVRSLIGQGADPNARDPEHGETALSFAARNADAPLVRLLIESGAGVNERDEWGRTAVFYAPLKSEAFEVIVGNGADIHARDKEGNSLLMCIVSESAGLAEVEALLRLGLDPRLKNEQGEDALSLATELGLASVIAKLEEVTG